MVLYGGPVDLREQESGKIQQREMMMVMVVFYLRIQLGGKVS